VDVDSYVNLHKTEWTRLEQLCRNGAHGLSKLSGQEIDDVVRLYLRVSSHLAEVQTRYHDPRLTEYLNQVVSRAHAAVYSGRNRSFRAAARLFGARYRAAIHRTTPFIAAAAAVLALVTVSTLLWTANSREARAGLVPPIARDAMQRSGGGSPFDEPPVSLSTTILVNNVQVSFFAFALGVGFGVGTVYLLVQNGALIGALAGAYTAAGHAGTFWTLVLPHGMLELTAICIAAGAGLRMGWALIDPGERTRGTALVQDAADAAIVILGVIPAFVIAAIIEGFLTPSTVAGPVKLAVGALVASAYLIFLIGPDRVYRRPNALTRR
jgi:uncharacterized membrane protein SpoIIM required for sporulation